MSSSTITARHRSAHRPVTPLTGLATAATQSMSVVGRRTAVVAASSGLAVSMVSAPAVASPADVPTSVDASSLAADARTALETSPVVTAPVGAAWSFDAPAVTAVEPAPAPTVRRAAAASRSATRTAVPQAVAGNAVLEIASRYVGVPYVYGGSTPAGFDCSGFVSYVYAQLGISLPHSSEAYPGMGTHVSRADARPGDIIWSPGHVAIYAGGNTQIDAATPGTTIQFRSIWQSSPVFIRIG